MKALNTRMMIFAAGAVAAAGMAYGQDRLKADIPFDFRLAHVTLPAGSYTFDRLMDPSGVDKIRVTGASSRLTVMSLPMDGNRKAAGKPSAVFACNDQGCALSELRTYDGTYVYPAQKIKEVGLTAVHVPLKSSSGD